MPTRYLRALIAVLFVSGIAGATFFVSSRLSSSNSVAPNAPDSNPQAAAKAQLSKEDREELAASKAQQQNNRPAQTQNTVRPKDERDDEPRTQTNNSQAGSTTVAPGSFTQANTTQYNQPTPKATNTPFQTPQNTGGGSNGSNQNTSGATPQPTIADNHFGYRPTDTTNVPDYMKPENNKCDDKLGFVSGTLCVTNPATGETERKLVNLPATIKARDQAVANARSQIENKTDQELLQIAAQSGKTCGNSDLACQQRTIQQITEKLLIDNAVVITKDINDIRNAREKNQLVQDAFGLSKQDFVNKYKGDPNTILALKEVDNSAKLATAANLLATYKDPNTSIFNLITAACKGSLNPECRNEMSGLSREQILKSNVGNSVSADYLNQTINQYKDVEKANKYISLFLDQNKSDKQKIEEYCKDFNISQSTCLKNIEINDLATYAADPKSLVDLKKDYTTQRIISDPNNDINDLAKLYCGGKTAGCTPEKILSQIKNEEVKQTTNDQLLAKIYSDAQNGTTDLAKVYCDSLTNPGPKCRDEYNQNAFLSLIKNPEVKQQAVNNRNQQLFQYIIPVKTNQAVSGIDVETKKEVEKFDTDFQHAYWAYWKEQTSGKTAKQVDNDKLGTDFYKLFTSDPSKFNTYISQYNANPKSFTDVQTATAFKAATDVNSSIIALNNQAVKDSPIKGLYEDNKIVSWSKASEDYKQEARKLACENDKSIAVYCTYVLSDSYASVSRTKEQRDNALAQIDAAIANSNKQTAYLQEVYKDKITNSLPSSFYSNTAAIDNYTIPKEIRDKAIQQAKNEITNQLANQRTSNPRAIAGLQYQVQNLSTTDFLAGNNQQLKNLKLNTQDLVSQKLDQMLVTETYTRGGGVAGSLAAAGLATTACAALGPGAAVCGAVGGLVGAVSTYVPILGTVTAEEMAAEKQKIADIEIFGKNPFQNESVSGIVQSLYSSQGALCDTAEGYSIGGSCTRKDNQYANYQSMLNTYEQYGANLSSLSDQNFVSQLAIQGTINQQFDALQRENQNQAIANIIVAPIIGAASGGIGGRLAQSSAPLNNPSYVQALLRQQAVDWALWAPGSAIGIAQNAAQFNATTGFIDTESEIKLEICIREKGASNCKTEQQTVNDETADARWTSLAQGFLTDTALQVGQSGFSFATQYAQLASQNSGQTSPPPDVPDPNGTVHISNSNVPAEIKNLISPPSDTTNSNSQNQPVGILNQGTNDAIDVIASGDNIIKTQEEVKNLLNQNENLDAADKTIALAALENDSYQKYVINPNEQTLQKLLDDINRAAEQLSAQFGGDVQTAKTGYVEALSRLNEKANTTGRPTGVVDALLAPVKSELGIAKNNTPLIASSPDTNPTPIDPYTEATERLINLRSTRNQDVTIDELKILLEGIDLTDKRISDLHDLQKNPNFQDAITKVSSAVSQAESAKKAIANNNDTTFFDNASNRIIFDLTSELAQKLSTPTTKPQAQQAVAQPNTPPPPVPPTKPRRANTAFVDGDNNYLLTLAKDLGVSTANKTDAQIRTEVKQEMNKRVFGNGNGPADPTGNVEIKGYIFRDDEGNVLSKDMYWRPDESEDFGDPFIFTREQADAIFANSNSWQFKPDRTLEVTYDPTSKTTKLASGIPFSAKIKEIDIDGNVKYTVDKIDGVVFVADKNSAEAKAAAKTQDPNSLVGKKVADLPIENVTKSPIEVLSDNSNLPNNLKAEIQNEYGPNQIAKLNNKLDDPNYKPSDNPLVRIIRRMELTPEAKLLNKAASLIDGTTGKPYDITTKNLSQIAIDIKTFENQISSTKNNTTVTDQQRAKSILAIPRRLAARMLEIQKLFPNAKTTVIDMHGGRVWSGNYLEGTDSWNTFLKNIDSISVDENQKKAIIEASREFLTDHIKSSILANNPDLIHSPKGPFEDIFTDINPNENESLGLMKKYFEEGGAFEKDFQAAANELNTVLENGGKIKRADIDKNWKIPKYQVDNVNAGKVLFMGLSLEFNPELPTKFHFLDNEVYSAVQGKDGQILNAAFAFELKGQGYIENVDGNFPIIRQTEVNDPNKSEKFLPKKNVTIRAKALDPETIKSVQTPTSTKAIFGDADLTPEQIKYLAQFNHETGTSAESLIASLNQAQREILLNNKITELEIKGVTDIEFNNTTQVARDISGLSVGTETVNDYISTPKGDSERAEVLDGWATLKSIMMESFDVEMKKIGNFVTHERAGDGALNTSINGLTSENIGQIVELSNIYKTNMDKALNGDFGPNVKRTAEILIEKLGDSVYLKVGISEGDTYATIHASGNGITAEFKSTSNVNQYMDNVKKYLAQQKKNNQPIPEKIISVSENIYKDFKLAGYTKFTIEIEGKTAYFIVKDPTQTVSAANTPPTPPTPPRKNNSVKKSIIEIIESITIAPKKTETKTNPVKQTYANLSTEKTTIAEFSKPVFDPKQEVQTILKETGQPRKIALSNFKELFGDQQRGLAQAQAKIAELLTVNSNVQTEQIRKMFNDNTQNLKLADWQKEEFETWLSKVDQKRKAMENIEKKYTKEQVFKIVFGDNMVYDQTQITIEYYKPTGIVFTMSSDYYTRVTGKSESNYGVHSFARIDGQSINTIKIRKSTPSETKISINHEIQHALYYLSEDIRSYLMLSDFDTSNKNLVTELAKYNFSKKTRKDLEKVLSTISRSISDRRNYAYIKMTDEMIARIRTGEISNISDAITALTSETYNFYKKEQDGLLSFFPLNDANQRFTEIKTSLAEYIRKDADANILADNLLDAYINARYNNVDNDTIMAVIDDIEDNITPKVQQKELTTFVEAYQNLFNETRGYSSIRRQLVTQIEGGFENSYNANIRRVVEDFYLNDAEQIHAIKTVYKNYTDLITSGLTSNEALAVLRTERTTKATRNIRYIIGDRDLIFQINNLLQKVSLKKARALTENIIDTMPEPIKITIKISAFTTPFTIPTAFWVGMNWNDIFNNQQTIPAPTPTAIYASPTPTITASPTPTITIQPTITISPTPTLFTPSTNVQVSYTLPKSQSLSSSQMREFSLTAKAVGQMIINCQNEGIYKDGPMVECICKQTTNNCADGSIEKTIAEDIAQLAGGKKPLECIGFMFSIERTRPAPIASGCEANFGNDMVPDKCAGAGSIGAYFCPQSVVEKNGFVEGDIIVTQDNRDGEPGHAEVCTELTNDGCTAIGANYDKNGLVAFRKVDSNSNFAGVWRGGSNIEGCTEY